MRAQAQRFSGILAESPFSPTHCFRKSKDQVPDDEQNRNQSRQEYTMKTRLTPTPLDCVVLGHYDLGFAFHENLTLARGTASGEYRTLRMDFVTVDGKK